ncbi:11065_t:CDS:1, partial [Ambispora gerdemannii]
MDMPSFKKNLNTESISTTSAIDNTNHVVLTITENKISKKQKRDDSDDEYSRRQHKHHKKSTNSKQRSSAFKEQDSNSDSSFTSKKHKKQEDSDYSRASLYIKEPDSENFKIHYKHTNESVSHEKTESQSLSTSIKIINSK